MTLLAKQTGFQHDFASAWHALTAADPTHRGLSQVDLKFWDAHAVGYDRSATQAGHYEHTLAAIGQLVRQTDTLLDVGSGSGRYSIPLASHVAEITALDHAAPMLDIQQDKLTESGVENVRLWEVDFDSAELPKHDVVLAAWSLYRTPDILAAMRKLIAATRRTLIILTSPGNASPDQQDTPMHLYFYGALWQAGVHPQLNIVWEYPAGHTGPAPVAMIVWNREQAA